MNFGVVSIIGTGLIGGSIGLGLKEKGLAKLVIGVGHRTVSINKALKIKAIDEDTTDIEKAVSRADIVILATSVDLIPRLSKRVIPSMKRSAILTDVGSTKNYIVSQIDKEIKGKYDGKKSNFIGAHPLAGSEQRGIESARSDLFEGSICVLTPTNLSSKKCITKISNLWRTLGAKVCILTPREHDEIVAFVSHLPHFVVSGLTSVVNEKHWKFAASGLRDTTRVASGDPKLWLNICKQNRAKLIKALRCFSKEIKYTLNDLEQGNDNEILKRLKKAKTVRDKYGKTDRSIH
ncbi:MAG: cyclohexadienyl dehydrogenase/5-enolpyruvylshikmate 3-P synthase [Candidatus Scalindua rubra]|uniref:Cyclohexadienyl dehydrogenase/5-enolpyruvylshikmate 3-P synthase n=1 Tax=Candidatus Scalindua rubra TaxID=1872076 RepID=A0A1E3XEW6_9BACT|nr:MAG: cyclohexadienyl dehydrogenase/5-enolpyruvylshikmate 3-P synthase [Candidatus Scalindua rubra]